MSRLISSMRLKTWWSIMSLIPAWFIACWVPENHRLLLEDLADVARPNRGDRGLAGEVLALQVGIGIARRGQSLCLPFVVGVLRVHICDTREDGSLGRIDHVDLVRQIFPVAGHVECDQGAGSFGHGSNPPSGLSRRGLTLELSHPSEGICGRLLSMGLERGFERSVVGRFR